MEKMCEWLWRPTPGQPQQTDAFYFAPAAETSPAKVLIYRAGEPPEPELVERLDTRNQNSGGYQAAWLREMLARKNYDRLMPNMRAAFDFLNARLGE